MAKKERFIDLTIGKDGKVQAEAIGYKGKGCADDIDEVLNGLGKKISSKKNKDYFDEQQLHRTQHS